MVSAPARREQVRYMVDKGLSERRALAVLHMSASALRYVPQPDRNVEVRERIVALAQRYKRYGVGMTHLKLRQDGMLVNYKRVELLYQIAQLQVRRRKRKRCCTASASRWCGRTRQTRSGRWTSCSIAQPKVG